MRPQILLLILGLFATAACADESAFTMGPVFKTYGPVADIKVTTPIPSDAVFRHSFDVSSPASAGEPNKTLVSAARFINMHVRAGVAESRIQLAVVVHGKAVREVADEKSDSAGLVSALIDKGVRIMVCGQSAAYYEVTMEDLLPGVEMNLSAMTAHALLQQQGYTLNPF